MGLDLEIWTFHPDTSKAIMQILPISSRALDRKERRERHWQGWQCHCAHWPEMRAGNICFWNSILTHLLPLTCRCLCAQVCQLAWLVILFPLCRQLAFCTEHTLGFHTPLLIPLLSVSWNPRDEIEWSCGRKLWALGLMHTYLPVCKGEEEGCWQLSRA